MTLAATGMHRSIEAPGSARQRIVMAFRRRYGSLPEIVVRAPGRINLIGAHIDHQGGWALPGAIDRSIWLAATPTGDARLTLSAVDLDDEREIDLRGLPDPGSAIEPVHWHSYPRAIGAALRDAGRDLVGMQVAYGGDLPSGAGVSSSAAIEVACALAWRTLGRWHLPDAEMAQAGRRAENVYLGVQSGAMDQLACLAGRSGSLLLMDCSELTCEPLPLPRQLAFLVVDSGTRRRLSGSGYNDRRGEAMAALACLQERRPELRSLRDLSPEHFDRLEAGLPEPLSRRARHVVHECDRVPRAAAALRAGDLSRLAGLVRASHISSRDLYEVSTPELDVLAEAAWETPGCHGARLSGGGFGGCVTALVDADAADRVGDRMSQALERRFGLEAKRFVARVVDGATVQ